MGLFGRKEKKRPVFSGHLSPENDDWTKQTWDLGIDNVKDLREWLEGSHSTVEHFKTLPVYRWNVDKPGMEWLKDL